MGLANDPPPAAREAGSGDQTVVAWDTGSRTSPLSQLPQTTAVRALDNEWAVVHAAEGRCSHAKRGGNEGTADVFFKDSWAVNANYCSDPPERNEPGEDPPLLAGDLRSPGEEVSNTLFRLLHRPCRISKGLCAEGVPPLPQVTFQTPRHE